MRTIDPDQWFKKQTTVSRRIQQLQLHEHNFEMRVRNSFCDAMKDYWRHCSLKGMNKLPRGYRRAVLAVTAGLAATVVALTALSQRTAPPLRVNLLSSQHSILRIPFPAVALCSTNAITRNALEDYTMFLYSRDQNNTYTMHDIRHNLAKFGALLTMATPTVDVMFMEFLTRTDPNFDVTRLMYKLSSSCEDVLRLCSWRGRAGPCERLFSTRVTPLGYCCVFNSRYYSEDVYRTPKYSDMIGKDFGLSVVVQENPDNFAFVRRPHIGLEILLFDGDEYPLLEGGGVRIYPVEQNSSVSITLSGRAQRPAAGVCERRAELTGYAWCLTRCRRRTLATLCACRLHTLPPDPADADPVCSLAHLDCLNKHREKLIYYYPHGYSEPALDEELQNGQECSQCAPDCTRFLYSASVAVARYSHLYRDKIFKNIFTRYRSLINSTTIRLFFASEHQSLYTVELNNRWFQIFVKISSQWTVVVGVSLVSVSELVYHCTVRWACHYRRRAMTNPPTLLF